MYDCVSSSASYGAVLFTDKPQLCVSTAFFNPEKSIQTAFKLGLIPFLSRARRPRARPPMKPPEAGLARPVPGADGEISPASREN